MSITAPLDKRTPASTLFAAYVLLIAAAGGALLYLGATRMAAGGWVIYPFLGVALVVAGIQLFRRRRMGLWVFALALLATWVWGLSASHLPPHANPIIDATRLPPALGALPEASVLLVAMALMGLAMLAFWPVVRRRLSGVAKPGYFIINGGLPVAMLVTAFFTRF